MSRQTQRASCSSGPRRGPDRRRTLRHACPHRLAVASTNRSRQSGPRRPQPGRVVRIGAGCTLQCNMPAKWLGRCRADQAPLVYLFPLPYADLGACDTVIPAVPPAIAGRAMWGPASAGGSPHHAPFHPLPSSASLTTTGRLSEPPVHHTHGAWGSHQRSSDSSSPSDRTPPAPGGHHAPHTH